MEKIVYVAWKKPDTAIGEFREEILERIGPRLPELGARKLAVNLADEQAEFAAALRITQMPEPLSATVSVWLDTALDRGRIEALLAAATARLDGYVVVESVPIVNTRHVVPPGERIPGLCTVAFLSKPDFLTYDAWLELWQGQHTRVAIETQSTFLYIQNVVVRPLTAGAPEWTAIVEECFPAEAASDPMVFYAAGGSPEKLKANQRRMFDSCRRFIDFGRLESHPMSAYVLKE